MADPHRQGEDTDILVRMAVFFVGIVGVGFLADHFRICSAPRPLSSHSLRVCERSRSPAPHGRSDRSRGSAAACSRQYRLRSYESGPIAEDRAWTGPVSMADAVVQTGSVLRPSDGSRFARSCAGPDEACTELRPMSVRIRQGARMVCRHDPLSIGLLRLSARQVPGTDRPRAPCRHRDAALPHATGSRLREGGRTPGRCEAFSGPAARHDRARAPGDRSRLAVAGPGPWRRRLGTGADSVHATS